MILSCVMRIRERLGYYVGKTLVVQVLRGSREPKAFVLGLASLSTYGLMDKTSPSVIERYIEYLESAGYLEVDPRAIRRSDPQKKHPPCSLTANAC